MIQFFKDIFFWCYGLLVYLRPYRKVWLIGNGTTRYGQPRQVRLKDLRRGDWFLMSGIDGEQVVFQDPFKIKQGWWKNRWCVEAIHLSEWQEYLDGKLDVKPSPMSQKYKDEDYV